MASAASELGFLSQSEPAGNLNDLAKNQSIVGRVNLNFLRLSCASSPQSVPSGSVKPPQPRQRRCSNRQLMRALVDYIETYVVHVQTWLLCPQDFYSSRKCDITRGLLSVGCKYWTERTHINLRFGRNRTGQHLLGHSRFFGRLARNYVQSYSRCGGRSETRVCWERIA